MQSLMRALAGTAALLLGAVTLSADDAKADKGKAPLTDQQFVIMAGSGGMHEVALGNWAKTSAGSPEVQKFGERMATDHTKANKALTEAAKSANVGVPIKMLDDHQKDVDRLTKLKGPEFDKAYMDHMVADHKEDIALFERAAKEATNPQLKQFATKTLPTLKEHLKMAEKVQGGLKGKK